MAWKASQASLVKASLAQAGVLPDGCPVSAAQGRVGTRPERTATLCDRETLKGAAMAWKDLRTEIADEFLDAQSRLVDLSRLIRARRAERAYDEFERRYQRWYYQTHRQEILERHRAYQPWYYQTHRQEILEQRRAYRAKHRERCSAYGRSWYQANRAKKLQYVRAWYQANRDKKREYARAWNRAHREEKRQYDAAYRLAHREAIRKKRAYYVKRREQIAAKRGV